MAKPLRRIRAASPDAAAPLFAALGDPVRLSIVAKLCGDGPLPTIQLQEGSGVSRQAISKHLQLLENTGLVRSDRVGRDRLWEIERGHLTAAREYLDRISAQWDIRLERLRVLVEE